MSSDLSERRELFVYYRVPASLALPLAEAVARMQEGLRAAHPGLGARLLRRPQAGDDGLHTWMEAYSFAPDSAVQDVAAAIDRAAEPLSALIRGPRHAEHFIACAS